MKKKTGGKKRGSLDLFVFLLVLGFFIINVASLVSDKKKQKESMDPIIEEIEYWKKITLDNHSYPDAWVKLAINWQKIGEDNLSKLAIDKARKMDPSRKDIEEIEEQLNLRYNN